MLWGFLRGAVLPGTPAQLDSEELDEPCFDPCYCEVKESLFHIHCDNKGFINISQITESWSRPFKLYLQRNSMRKLYTNSFLHLNNAVSINLGNNALQDIQTGAFNGLRVLKRLYLHENKLDIFRNDTFLGLESLEYLQADYNVIKRIESGAFRNLSKLRVLILNDNLIPMLPTNLFKSVSLTHLDLRGNRLKVLSYRGMLDHIGRSLMEIQLEENPWNCTCEIVQLKSWLERIPYTALVGDITCETPFHFHGKDLREIKRSKLCPMLSDSEVEASLGIPHTKRPTSSPSPPSSPGPRPPPTPRGLYPGPNQPPVAAYQTRPPIPIICPTGCSCSLHINDLGLTVNCKEPLNAKKLYLSGNLIQKIYRSDFWNFSSLDLLHLGNNRISYVQDGAFINLPNLKSLYLNGNDIERLTPGMFRGLQSLHYLYFEYNLIREIQPAAFSLMPNLKLLFLNDNLLRTLPTDAFAGTSLARLNLRNNHFLALPVAGVLEHLHAIVQIDLKLNPWDCTCDLVPLKQWLEALSSVSVVGEVLCASPEPLARRDLRSLELAALCPAALRPAAASPPAAAPPPPAATGAAAYELPPAAAAAAVPLSVLILSLLVLFFSAVLVAAGLFAFVLRRRRRKLPFRGPRAEAADLGRSPEKAPPAGHVYDYIPHPVTQMCNNPIYKPREEEEAHPAGGGLAAGALGAAAAAAGGAPRDRDRPPPCAVGFVDCLYGTVPKLKELHVHPPGMQYPDLQQDARLKETLLFAAGKGFPDHQTPTSEYLELRAKLQTKPDYLEVLEKTTYRF
uniref:Uncharacterized protein n=1 Tax=Geospiza parvula TaxID=87175 RepID=A0A8C3QA54_GEOPR